MTDIVAIFVAGPAIKNTKAIPGSAPACIKAIANGTEAVAHVYIGIAIRQIANKPIVPFNPKSLKKLSPKNVDTNAARNIP